MPESWVTEKYLPIGKKEKIGEKIGNKVELPVTKKNPHSAEFCKFSKLRENIKSASLPFEIDEKSADTLIFCNMQLSNNLPVISHSLVVKKRYHI